ncbi:MAG TPA: hypothetical protein VK668_22175 [Mucilaginibacter sp.]|nr:hypothetical protein [Mucilaginibacter sp.]
MKRLLGLILLALALNASGQTKQDVPFRTIRTLLADLNNDKKTDTVTLISSLKERNSFNRIVISLSGSAKKTFNAKDYWTVVDSEFLATNKNTIHTKLLFLKKTAKHSVILLFGELNSAGYRGEFSIINIENNHITMPFDALNDYNGSLDIEMPVELKDLENNGRLCFVYTDIFELDGFSTKAMKANGTPDIGGYSPYFVYRVNDTCKLDIPLTKSYNKKNYVDAASLDLKHDIRILYPRNGGKPRIWKKPYFH